LSYLYFLLFEAVPLRNLRQFGIIILNAFRIENNFADMLA